MLTVNENINLSYFDKTLDLKKINTETKKN